MVIKPGHKTFRFYVGGQAETITVDRLKQAHVDLDDPVEVTQPKPKGRPTRNSRKMIKVPKPPFGPQACRKHCNSETSKNGRVKKVESATYVTIIISLLRGITKADNNVSQSHSFLITFLEKRNSEASVALGASLIAKPKTNYN